MFDDADMQIYHKGPIYFMGKVSWNILRLMDLFWNKPIIYAYMLISFLCQMKFIFIQLLIYTDHDFYVFDMFAIYHLV